MAISRWAAPAVFVAAVVGAGFLWHEPWTRATEAKPPALDAARPAPGTRLVVDFRDDVSTASLEANGYVEIPVSDYSARDRLYDIDFATVEEAEAARARLAADPNVESVDYDAQMTIPPDEAADETAALLAAGSMEAECDGAAAARPSPSPSGVPNDPCFKYQWHLRQLGLPDAWKLGTGIILRSTGGHEGPTRQQSRQHTGYMLTRLHPNSFAKDDGTKCSLLICQTATNGARSGKSKSRNTGASRPILMWFSSPKRRMG